MAEGEKQNENAGSGRPAVAEAFAGNTALKLFLDARPLRRLGGTRPSRTDEHERSLRPFVQGFPKFGLSLVKKNTGRTKFVLGAEAVDAPDSCLSELVGSRITRRPRTRKPDFVLMKRPLLATLIIGTSSWSARAMHLSPQVLQFESRAAEYISSLQRRDPSSFRSTWHNGVHVDHIFGVRR